MKQTTIAIAALALFGVTIAWFGIRSIHYESPQGRVNQLGHGDVDKLVSAAQTYAGGLKGQGLPVPASVSMKELIARGLLTEADVSSLFNGMEVTMNLFVDKPRPQDVLVRARLPDGQEIVALADGFVGQMQK